MALENMDVSKSRIAVLPKPDGDRLKESGRSFMSIGTCYYTILRSRSKDSKAQRSPASDVGDRPWNRVRKTEMVVPAIACSVT